MRTAAEIASAYGFAEAPPFVDVVRFQVPPTPLVGTRARWGGGDFVADVAGSEVVLTRFDEAGDGGWAQVRPGAWTRQVPLGECEVFEVVHSATLSGVPVRVLATDRKVCYLQITGDPDAAQSLGAVMIEPGVFELGGVPVSDLADHRLVANEWSR